MVKQSLRFVSYLLFSISFAILVTLIADNIENTVVEQRIKKEVELEIRNAAVSFEDSASKVVPGEMISFIKKFSSSAMKDKVIAVDPIVEPKPDRKAFQFLFAFSDAGGLVNIYIKNSYLHGELALVDVSELIFGMVTTIVGFTFITLYTEKKRQTLMMKNQYEIKHAELTRAMEEHEALTLLGRMTATLAHELKTPVATISNLVHVLPARIADSNFTSRFITITKEELSRTQQLIDNLLIYGKAIEIRKREWIPLKPFMRQLSAKHNLECQCLEMEIYGDPFYLGLLFENILRNSSESGARHIAIKAGAPAAGDESLAALLVEDDGKGFPDGGSLDELINPFVTSRSRGSGLGLYLVKRIATAHGGTISLYRMQEGAGVEIYLPRIAMKYET